MDKLNEFRVLHRMALRNAAKPGAADRWAIQAAFLGEAIEAYERGGYTEYVRWYKTKQGKK